MFYVHYYLKAAIYTHKENRSETRGWNKRKILSPGYTRALCVNSQVEK